MPPEEIQKLRDKARQAMEGEERRQQEIENDKTLSAKRHTAALAMEGAERRVRREQKEKELREKEEMLRRIDEEVKTREAEAAKKKAEAEEARKNLVAEHEHEIKQKEKDFADSQNTIEQLKEERGSTLKAIRTLKSDLDEAVASEQITMEKIALATQKRGETAAVEQGGVNATNSNGFGGLLLALFVILVLAGAGFWGFKYYKLNFPVSSAPFNIESIIFTDKNQEIDVARVSAESLTAQLSSLTAASSTADGLGHIYFVKTRLAEGNSETVPQKELLSFRDWQEFTHSAIPADFARFVSRYMLGLYQGQTGNALFLALKVDPYDNVYATLLDHENDWVRQVFESLDGRDLRAETADQSFEDYLLKNLNTRALRKANGQIVLIYTFLDRQTFIIAESEAALYQAYTAYNTARPR
jgi:hypothetical protein